jgi:hypothetical protein
MNKDPCNGCNGWNCYECLVARANDYEPEGYGIEEEVG